ncbi:MAG: leucine-rich repeat protein [Clostridia bacterium]|nr:leucine-rich repeat protein [Clostridia bacterium]
MLIKRLLSIVTLILFLSAILPFSTFNVIAATTSGTCGTNVIWEYDTTTKTLTISGIGAMENYGGITYSSSTGDDITTAPWGEYYNTMKKLVIVNGVTSIGNYAFWGCSGLTSVTIGNSVTLIGDDAFSHCSGLTSITIPNSVTVIGSCAFSDCTGLTAITIPDSITLVGNGAFGHCLKLKRVNITDLAAWCRISFGEIDTHLFDTNPLYYARLYISGTLATDIIIPDSVTSIGNGAFCHYTALKSITIPNSVTSIGDFAFENCTGLTSITIPNSVTSIGKHAFEFCTGFTSIKIPNSVTSIGDYAFAACKGLISFVIPDSVTNINAGVFGGCSKLASITISDSVTSIGEGAFWGCVITNITIPNSVISIGDYAFDYCGYLKSVHYQGTAQQWQRISIGTDNSYFTSANRTYCTYGKWFTKIASTCTEPGLEYRICTICGNEVTRSVDALGHNYAAVVTTPTCTEAGYTTYTCSRCGDTYVGDETPAAGHTLGGWLTDAENHWHVCEDCAETVDKAAHIASDWIIDVEATATAAGYMHKECTVCGKVLENGYIPKIVAHTPGDINGDGEINNKDLIRLFRYLSNWDVEVNPDALDVNGDGMVNNKDLTRLFQYLSDWDVEISHNGSDPIISSSFENPRTGLLWPVAGYYAVSKKFGNVKGVLHNGIDISGANISGHPILSIADGVVCSANNSWDAAQGTAGNASYGNYCVINHGNISIDGSSDEYTSLYAHATGIVVSPGETVKKGQVIGYVGSTGDSTAANLHIGIQKNGAWVDPFALLRK